MVAGCANLGVFDDGTTVSYGMGNNGALHNGVRMPAIGDGYWIPPRWSARGSLYGTDELVTLVVRVARRLQRELPGAPPIGVADLSPTGGGPSRWHRSHQTGRDVDLLFFVTDAAGKPLKSKTMWRMDVDGATPAVVQRDGSTRPRVYFDVERNWALVRALLQESSVEVQYIFVAEFLEDLMLEHAIAAGEPYGLIEHARWVLHQPSDSAAHDDHFHVRIYCPVTDRTWGCQDRGALRWKKKGYKYELMEAGNLGRGTQQPAVASGVANGRMSLHGFARIR